MPKSSHSARPSIIRDSDPCKSCTRCCPTHSREDCFVVRCHVLHLQCWVMRYMYSTGALSKPNTDDQVNTPSTPSTRIIENPMPAIQIPHKRPTNIKRKQCVPSVLAMEIADRGRYRLPHATNSRTTADLQGHPPFSASVLGGTRITSDWSPSILLVPCLGHYLQDLRIVASSMSRRPTFASIVCRVQES